ncbi:MAG: efflux RND transporter permease subunit [Pseudomonadota bacterium]|nr:efflux RND transporter permease subunit [Pseudomonadota bacterium]
MKPIIGWFANNHVAANLLMGLIILSGLVSLPRMPVTFFPDVEIPQINVSVAYLGAAPEEVEEGVCIRIEEELEGIEGVKEIRSSANEGMCTVSVEIYESADENRALDDVKNRIDSIDTFPEETEKPIVNLITTIRNVLDIALTGPTDERTLKALAEQIRDDIMQLPGVTQSSVSNARPYEISIEVSEASLRRNGLSFDQVASAVRKGSLDLPGGSIKTAAGEILLRTKGQAYWGDEYENLVVKTGPDGTRLYLKDVAQVVDGFADTDQSLRFNGKPAALIQVSRMGDQDLLEVSGAVKQFLKDLKPRLSEGVELTVWNDDSVIVEDRLSTLLDSGRQGFLMVLILLALFLRPRLAFWVSVGVPVAFLGAIFLTNAIGLSIDAISIFGFILVLGILVDDAIVIGESVHSRHQEGLGQLAGAIEGAQRVTIPVTFGVLTTVVAFIPLLLGIGFFGQVMGVIASTVICCLIFSLVESQMVLPAHLGHTSVKSPTGEVGMMLVPIAAIVLLGFAWDIRSYIALTIAVAAIVFALHTAGLFTPIAERFIQLQSLFAAGLQNFIQGRFKRAVAAAVNARYVTAAIAFVALLSAIAVVISGRLPFSFFPPLASDQIVAQLTMPLGTSSEVTDKAILRLERSAQVLKARLNQQYPGDPPVKHIMAAIGDQPSSGNGPATMVASDSGSTAKAHLGEVVMQLTPSETRALPTREIADMWRDANGPIADAVELKFNTNLFSVGNDIDIQLEGDNVDELREIAERLRYKLAEYPGVVDITDSFRSGKQELKLSILPSGEALGLSLGDLARQVRQAFYGEEAQRIQRGRDDVRVMVRYTQAERSTLAALDTMRIRTPGGSQVPFTTVAKAELGRGFSTIRRSDSRRVVNVIADVDRTQITANEVLADLRSGPMQTLMAPYPRVSYSLEGAQADQTESMASLLPLYVIALFVIFTLLAIPLKSYAMPLIIMSVIPFAFMGAIWGHLFMQNLGYVSGLAMMSMLGVVAASGVVVNSSLVLAHNIDDRISRGQELFDSVVDASVSRCRPILLTSLTTFVGLSPLMLNTSVAAQTLVPMAVSLAFGVLFSTVVTLFVVPAGFVIIDELIVGFKRIFTNSSKALSSAD